SRPGWWTRSWSSWCPSCSGMACTCLIASMRGPYGWSGCTLGARRRQRTCGSGSSAERSIRWREPAGTGERLSSMTRLRGLPLAGVVPLLTVLVLTAACAQATSAGAGGDDSWVPTSYTDDDIVVRVEQVGGFVPVEV